MLVSAIIPAYNEQETIASVVNTVKKTGRVDEIIVVNDGSYDKTPGTAERCGAKVISLTENIGKGAAIKAGLDHCKGDVILLLDADLIGLKEKHIVDMLNPVLEGKCDMTIGIFKKGRFVTNLAHKISPFLSGQRVVKRSILEAVSDIAFTGYGVEIALTDYVEKQHICVLNVELEDITHLMKEEKMGFLKGIGQRVKMYWQLYKRLKLVRR